MLLECGGAEASPSRSTQNTVKNVRGQSNVRVLSLSLGSRIFSELHTKCEVLAVFLSFPHENDYN